MTKRDYCDYYLLLQTEVFDLRRVWRQDDNNDQGFNYLTRIPLSQFFLATQAGSTSKLKQMPLFGVLGKISKTTPLDFSILNTSLLKTAQQKIQLL